MSDIPPAVGPQAGPCQPWCTIEDVRACAPFNDADTYSDEALEQVIDAASDVLFQRAGRRWPGLCSDTVYPSTCAGCGGVPLPYGGSVSLATVRGALGGGSLLSACCGDQRLDLGSYPVRSVTQVLIDGVELDPAAYEVRDWEFLYRVDGGRWPCVSCPTSERLEVSFEFGEAPPWSGRGATVALARELARSCAEQECGLDRRVTTLSREGVTMTLPGLVDTLRDGRTGIPEVDLFLWSHNPNGLIRRGRIIDPAALVSSHRRTFPAQHPPPEPPIDGGDADPDYDIDGGGA